MFTASNIEKNRILEGTKAEISSVATKLTRHLEENIECNFEKESDTIRNSISELCPTFGCHLSLSYERIYKTYYRQTVLPCLENKHGEELLQELCRRMINHKFMESSLSEIFGNLNNFLAETTSWTPGEMPQSLPHVLYNRERGGTKIRNVEDLATLTFRDEVLLKINSKSKASLMKMIAEERDGSEIDKNLLKVVLDFYVQSGIGTLEIYKEHFEIFLLQETASYYACKASTWIQEYSCPEYMIKSEESLKKEKARVTHYLHSSTEPKLVEIVQTQLLVLVAKQLVDKEHSVFRALLKDDKVDDLSRIYRLYHDIPKVLEHVAVVFRLHIDTEGNTFIKQAEDSATSGSVDEQVLVGKIIDLHDKCLVYVTDCFQNHTLFHKALKEAFEIFFSKKVAGSRSAELLATFLDNLFKKSENDKSFQRFLPIVSTIDSVVKLIVYISDKDLFAEFYRKKLAHCLLFDRSGGDGRERSILLSRLKGQFGDQFTSLMEGMVTDMELSKEIQSGFVRNIENGKIAKPEVDLNVNVLTIRSWPKYKTSNLNLPVEMVKCVEAFEAFYKTITKQRKLIWNYSLGKCHVTGRFDAKSIDLVVSTYQAAVLCVFNNKEKLTYHEIIEELNLSREDLSRVLHSLSCLKHEILKKEPASKTISETDVFEFNSKFTNKLKKIWVPLPPRDERKRVVEEVFKDRPNAIDACLVKIMKDKKVLLHQQLIAECVERLSRKFKPDIKMIKKRIESLMEREYLERDTEDPNTFRYLA